ncbi:hypothetical protein DRQ50_04545 [bacterium]|nr:MAG: hypothetical protein DRQ50_04545 [bacterium]
MTLVSHLRSRYILPYTAILLLAGCGGGGPGTSDDMGQAPPDLVWPDEYGKPSDQRPECDGDEKVTVRGGSFVVAVTDSVRPARAPLPGNDGERLVFAQLYEGLVEVACDGSLAPGLAIAWESDDAAAVWTFTLREGARLWDGTPITAQMVDEAWRRNRTLPGTPTRLDLLPLQIRVLDEHHLEVRPARPNTALPHLLAHPAWAVAVDRPGWTWPVGSGPARLRASTPPPLPEIVCRPHPSHRRSPRWKQLVFTVQPGGDARDLVASGADLLLVRDRVSVDFYRELNGYEVAPLPWNRLHLLVISNEVDQETDRRLRDAAAALDPARDLDRTSAVPWTFPTLPGGPVARIPVGKVDPVPQQGRLDSELARTRLDVQTVVHDRNDPAAAELAGRLTALAGSGIRTVGLTGHDTATALQWRLAGAGVLTIAPAFADPALQLADLAGRFIWLGKSARAVERIVPVAVSRPWLVTRGGVTGMEFGGDGTIHLSGLGAVSGPAVP